jgi:nicotinamidase-related amidase
MFSATTALLVIDVQQGLDDPLWGERNNPGAEQNIARLLAFWRRTHRPVIHVQHMSGRSDSPLRPGLPGNAIKPEAAPAPGEPIFRKTVNSAFIGTALEAHLRAEGIDTLILVGLTTDHCVSTTTRMAANLGFSAIVVSDGTATFERTGPDGDHHSAEEMHQLALASLHQEFATVRRTGEVLAEAGSPERSAGPIPDALEQRPGPASERYLVVEYFRHGDPVPVYRRFQEKGRLMPDGLAFVSSWVTEDLTRCYQVVEAADRGALNEWMRRWADLVDFEVHPVLSSGQVQERLGPLESAEPECPP